jgi:hypothetical protein
MTTLSSNAFAQDIEPVDVGEMSRDDFVALYLDSYEAQLDWTKEAFARVEPEFAQNVDADGPITDTERAIPACLYDAADTEAKKEQLGLQLATVARLGEIVASDPSVDYVDVTFGDVIETVGFQPSQDLASMMQDCSATQAAMQRMSLSTEVFEVFQGEAISRGYLEP